MNFTSKYDLYFPLFQFYDNGYKTKKIQVELVWNHFNLKCILTYDTCNPDFFVNPMSILRFITSHHFMVAFVELHYITLNIALCIALYCIVLDDSNYTSQKQYTQTKRVISWPKPFKNKVTIRESVNNHSVNVVYVLSISYLVLLVCLFVVFVV